MELCRRLSNNILHNLKFYPEDEVSYYKDH